MSMEAERCELCGRRFDRPSFYKPCANKAHPPARVQDDIAEAVEMEIHRRKGIGWCHLDDEIVDDIRDSLVDVVLNRLQKHFPEGAR